MNPSAEIAAQLDHIVSGKCRWVPHAPQKVIGYTVTTPPQQACLVERIDSEHWVLVKMSPRALWHTAHAIAELHPGYEFTSGWHNPNDALDNAENLYGFCVNWNDRYSDLCDDPRTEAQVIEVLERACKLALIDEGM